MSNVLVVGASGFLGSHIADILTEQGHAVTLYDRTPSPWRQPGQEEVVADVLDREALSAAMPNLGFAAFHDLSAFADAPRTPYVTDAALADQVLDLLATSNRPLFVFAITIEAHGPWTADRTPLTAGTNLDRYLWYLARTDAMDQAIAQALEAARRFWQTSAPTS